MTFYSGIAEITDVQIIINRCKAVRVIHQMHPAVWRREWRTCVQGWTRYISRLDLFWTMPVLVRNVLLLHFVCGHVQSLNQTEAVCYRIHIKDTLRTARFMDSHRLGETTNYRKHKAKRLFLVAGQRDLLSRSIPRRYGSPRLVVIKNCSWSNMFPLTRIIRFDSRQCLLMNVLYSLIFRWHQPYTQQTLYLALNTPSGESSFLWSSCHARPFT